MLRLRKTTKDGSSSNLDNACWLRAFSSIHTASSCSNSPPLAPFLNSTCCLSHVHAPCHSGSPRMQPSGTRSSHISSRRSVSIPPLLRSSIML